MAQTSSPQAHNDIYRVKITSSSPKFAGKGIINAWLPEEFQTSIESTWDAPFADLGQGKLNSLLGLLGASLKSKFLSSATWQGTSPMVVTLPLDFITSNTGEPQADVLIPIKTLQQMVVPDVTGEGEIFIPPGPGTISIDKIAGAKGQQISAALNRSISGGEIINIHLGRFMTFKTVVILNVAADWPMKLAKDGPLRARATVTFRTHKVLTKDDFNDLYSLNDEVLSQPKIPG